LGLPTRRRTAKKSSPSPLRGEGGGEGVFPACLPTPSSGLRPPSLPRGRGRFTFARLRISSRHHCAAVHHQGLARDAPRLVGGEKHRRPPDVFGSLLASHGHKVGNALL